MNERDDEARDERAPDQTEEQAWRQIVDNYGEWPVVPDEHEAAPVPQPQPFRLELFDDAFVPPPLPPPPVVAPERRVAWVFLVGVPVALVVLALAGVALPGILTAGLIVGCLVSFGYLVATMSTDPRDPDDDGARL